MTPYQGPGVLDGSLAGDKAADAFDRWFVRTYGPDGLGRPGPSAPKEAKASLSLEDALQDSEKTPCWIAPTCSCLRNSEV